ncbi:MAG: monovalent cation:proton antiporter-2 (CPA2) family protein [Wenzhouxiangellaceae bacterium]|nr:monovalent cation:proton antiporter-2 (CPA2) family protein [Wenzhouxiangellaceae bacterium]
MGSLAQVIIFLASAVIMVPLARKLGLGAVLGYLAAGILIGPWVLGLIADVEAILHFSELGVVLLLFVIGLELRPNRLKVLRRLIFVDGTLQLVLTTLALWPLATWWLDSLHLGLLVAVVMSLSSTAIGLQMLAEKKQLSTAYGRSAFGILLLQDMAVIPLLALIPLFGSGPGGGIADEGVLLPIARTVAIIAAIIIGGHFLLRPMLRIIVLSGVREVFLAAVLLLALGTALLAEWAGLSMALGAFLAGVLLSDSEFRHELEAGIDPFKGLLLGLFFIAVGMSIDFGRIVSGPGLILGIVVALMLVKFGVLWLVGRLAGLDSRSSLSLAFALPQAGEFGFILFSVAQDQTVLGASVVDPLIVAISISMALTPLMYFINERWIQPGLGELAQAGPEFEGIPDDHGEPRVIIAGLGRVGQIVARNLSMLDIHFTALDHDQRQVDFVRRFGHRVFYGNATNIDVLRAAGIEQARLFVLTLSDIDISLRTAEMIKRHYPHLTIHARARNRQHALELKALGVEYVIREAWLSSLDLARESLRVLGVKNPARIVDLFRQHDEQALEEQVGHKDDDEQMLEIDRRSREQLVDLFDEDRAFIRSGDDSSKSGDDRSDG